MFIQAIKRNATKKTGDPLICVVGGWAGHEPITVYALHRRKPTDAERAAAIDQWKREQAAAKPTHVIHDANVKLYTQQPGQGAGDEENEQ